MSGEHRIGRDGSLLTILFDRDCGICGFTARTLRRWDRNHRFRVLALQNVDRGGDPQWIRAVAGYALADELHIVDPDGRAASGGDAVLAIVDALPGGRLLRPWAAIPFVRSLVRLAYRGVASNRAAIGRWVGLELVCDTSAVPEGQPSSPRSR